MNIETAEELALIWNTIKSEMDEKKTMSETAYETWFSDLSLVALENNKIVFSTTTETKRKIIREKFTPFLSKCVENALGYKLSVELIFTPTEKSRAGELFNYNILKIDSEVALCQGLNTEYTFDNFVVGSSNQFAHACAVAVSNDPGGSHGYNPLFIYGPSGLGKTHLMYAIANKVHYLRPDMSIICVNGEAFMNELIDCISKKTTAAFREKYRKADMLLIDDVQFIAGKVQTQEEFFHTFNYLIDSKKQIILTSDRPPKEMYTLEERMRTRFVQGMLADVQPPEYELRLAILRRKAEKSNMIIPNDVLHFLAEKLNSNIREIEGCLRKIGAISFLGGKDITLDLVKTSIPEFLHETKPVTETVENIIDVTARKYDVTVEEILGTKRTKNIKTARNISMFVTKKVLNLTFKQIGNFMNRDHSTVMSNIQTVELQIETDKQLENEINEIIAEVKS